MAGRRETLMELERAGSQPSAKAPAEYFTGNVRVGTGHRRADARPSQAAASVRRPPGVSRRASGAPAAAAAARRWRRTRRRGAAPARPPRPAHARRSCSLRELGLGAWPISPCSRAISLASRSVSAATSISTCSASRDRRPARRPAACRVASANAASSANTHHLGELGQRLQQRRRLLDEGRRRRRRSSGTRCAGDRFISLRRLRQVPTSAFSCATQASACGSIFSSCACG